jgi:glyoxylase-like metal-dependent hydrolase (beta-lactamase superfamily II)
MIHSGRGPRRPVALCVLVALALALAGAPARAAEGAIQAWHVQGQVWLLAGEPGQSNVVAQVGDQGVLVVDTGTTALAPALVAEIRRLARGDDGAEKPISMVVNTNGRSDHMGGNEEVRKAGRMIVAGEMQRQQDQLTPGAMVFAHQNVQMRLLAALAAGQPTPPRSLWPTFLDNFNQYSVNVNGEAVQFFHPLDAGTDEQLVVTFRRSDVIATGDVFDMTAFPHIDPDRGGTIDGELVALNRLVEMTVPLAAVEGGTLIVPGHGRVCDIADLIDYRTMVTIIRNLVQFHKNQGKSLEQVLALHPTEGYDERWSGAAPGSSAREFVAAIYRTLPPKGPASFAMQQLTVVPPVKGLPGTHSH